MDDNPGVAAAMFSSNRCAMARSSMLTRCIPLLLATALAAQQTPADAVEPSLPLGAPAAMAEIDRAELRSHVDYFAAEELGGRLTATPGQLAASGHVAAAFESLGLEPLGDRVDGELRGFEQRYPLRMTYLDTASGGLSIGEQRFGGGYALITAGAGELQVEGALLCLGHGQRQKLPAVLAEGVVPLVILRSSDRPQLSSAAQSGIGLSMLAKVRSATERLRHAGAEVVLFGMLHDDAGFGEVLNSAALAPGKPLLAFGRDAGAAGRYARVSGEGPSLFLSSRLTRAALAAAGWRVVDGELLAPERPPVVEVGVDLRVRVDGDARGMNVVGLLRGSDPQLSGEALVYSAHIDHIGRRLDGEVFRGADDNASGSAALLEIAQAFAAGERPRRSVIFLSVSGEELGLWGSEWFVKNSGWPIENIVANVNIDMIGRSTPLSGVDEISVTPSYRNRAFSSVARGAAELAPAFGLGVTDGDRFYTRSDHYNFAIRDVPVVFFCDGEHEDYHQVGDLVDRLDFAKILRVARLAYWTGERIANVEQRPIGLGRRSGWLPEPDSIDPR